MNGFNILLNVPNVTLSDSKSNKVFILKHEVRMFYGPYLSTLSHKQKVLVADTQTLSHYSNWSHNHG